MPAHPDKLKPYEPAERPKGIPDGVWQFPRNLADVANRRGISQKKLAELLGVSQSTISRWMHYQGVESLAASTIVVAERELGVPHGFLTLASRAAEFPAGSYGLPEVPQATRDQATELVMKGGAGLEAARRVVLAAIALDPPAPDEDPSDQARHLAELAAKLLPLARVTSRPRRGMSVGEDRPGAEINAVFAEATKAGAKKKNEDRSKDRSPANKRK